MSWKYEVSTLCFNYTDRYMKTNWNFVTQHVLSSTAAVMLSLILPCLTLKYSVSEPVEGCKDPVVQICITLYERVAFWLNKCSPFLISNFILSKIYNFLILWSWFLFSWYFLQKYQGWLAILLSKAICWSSPGVFWSIRRLLANWQTATLKIAFSIICSLSKFPVSVAASNVSKISTTVFILGDSDALRGSCCRCCRWLIDCFGCDDIFDEK